MLLVAFLLALRVAMTFGVFAWFCYDWAKSHGMHPRRWLLVGALLGPLSIVFLVLATKWPSEEDDDDAGEGGTRLPAPPHPPRRGPVRDRGPDRGPIRDRDPRTPVRQRSPR